jgi:hypothetical protein
MHPGHSPEQQILIQQIAFNDLRSLYPGKSRSLTAWQQAAYLKIFVKQSLDKMLADKAGCAGNENHRLCPYHNRAL